MKRALPLLALVCVASCGSPRNVDQVGVEPPTTGGVPRATTLPRATPARTAPRNPGPPIHDRGVTFTPIAIYGGRTQMALRGKTLAVVVPAHGGGAELRVSTNGRAPRLAVGAGPIPGWGQPHVGTDSDGHVVVTYPRCATTDLASCDVYEWTLGTQTERRMDEVSDALPETEAVEDHGSELVVRERLTSGTRGHLPTTTKLLYKPVSGPPRALRRSGGRTIDLAGGLAVDAYYGFPDESGLCGNVVEQLLAVPSGAVQHSTEILCGDYGQMPNGLSLARGHLTYNVTMGSESPSPDQLVDYDAAARNTRVANPHLLLDWWATDAPRTGNGWALVGKRGLCTPVGQPDGNEFRDTTGACRLGRISGLQWKSFR